MKKIILVWLLFLAFRAEGQPTPFFSAETNGYGYRNDHGEVIATPTYELAWTFAEGLAPVKRGNRIGYINEKGVEVITPRFEEGWMFSDGLAVVKIDGKYGFIDRSGKLVVAAQYDRCDNFHGDRANVCLNKHWQVLVLHK